MLTSPDFSKKQVVFVFFNDGEKLAFSNDNIVVKDKNGKIKFQCTCYRIFIIFAIGHASITSALIQRTKKFGFFIALMTSGFRLYALIGDTKEGNTLLRRRQYQYNSLDLAKMITANKAQNQLHMLKAVRDKNDAIKDAISVIEGYIKRLPECNELSEIMAYEGLISKLYFKNHFNNLPWSGRQPRIKRDYINAALDIGYTLLFTFIDALLLCYGFDTYCGVMHRPFYMRKSLVCDLVEPFRPLIDHQIKKGVNLSQIKQSDFLAQNNQYRLQWEHSPRYVKLLISPIIKRKTEIFEYIQSYYRCFMKNVPEQNFPKFNIGDG